MKPYYRVKGKYKDGRKRMVLEYFDENGVLKSFAIPKPEKILKEKDIKFSEGFVKKKQKYIKNWGIIKAKVLARDNYKCSKCETIKRVLVHHIDGNRKHNKLSNLVTLCPSCHGETHYKMDRQKMENFPLTNQLNNRQAKPVH